MWKGIIGNSKILVRRIAMRFEPISTRGGYTDGSDLFKA